MRWLSGLVLVAGAVTSARADSLTTHGVGGVLEGSYHLSIEVRGMVAKVEARQRLLAGGAIPVEALYDLELPGGAVVTGFTVTPVGSKTQPAIAVRAGALDRDAMDSDDAGALKPDLGALRMVAAGRPSSFDDPGSPATYRYTAYPVIAAGTDVTVTWWMPLRMEQGRLVLELPARHTRDLVPTTGAIRFVPVRGFAAPRDLRIGGVLVSRAPGTKAVSFAGPKDIATALVIEADVAIAGNRPIAVVDAADGALAVTVAAPAARKPIAADRIAFVVDASRSMRRIDRSAVIAAIDAAAVAAPSRVEIAAVGFDRTAKLLVDWRANGPASRKAIADAVRGLGDGNGSDLRAGLTEVARLAARGAGKTHVVIVGDGGISVDVDADRLDGALGGAAIAAVSSLIVIGVNDAAPAHGRAVLTELARRHGGRVRAVTAVDAAERASRLVGDAIGGDPLSNLSLANATIALPASLAPGDGAISFGSYTGTAPRRLAGTFGKRATTIAAGTSGVAPAIFARVQAVSDRNALVVVDTSDQLGRDRRSLIVRGGAYTRIATPFEHKAPIDWSAPPASGPAPGGTITPDVIKNILTIELLPKLRGCFQQALVRSPNLAGRVMFDLLMGDGELIAATTDKTTDVQFDACLAEVAHGVNVPIVADPSIIRVRYPIDFKVTAEKQYVVLGDADSSEPIDPSLLPSTDGVRTDEADQPLGGAK
jgi:Mg-chelatase subunit ChlD